MSGATFAFIAVVDTHFYCTFVFLCSLFVSFCAITMMCKYVAEALNINNVIRVL